MKIELFNGDNLEIAIDGIRVPDHLFHHRPAGRNTLVVNNHDCPSLTVGEHKIYSIEFVMSRGFVDQFSYPPRPGTVVGVVVWFDGPVKSRQFNLVREVTVGKVICVDGKVYEVGSWMESYQLFDTDSPAKPSVFEDFVPGIVAAVKNAVIEKLWGLLYKSGELTTCSPDGFLFDYWIEADGAICVRWGDQVKRICGYKFDLVKSD